MRGAFVYGSELYIRPFVWIFGSIRNVPLRYQISFGSRFDIWQPMIGPVNTNFATRASRILLFTLLEILFKDSKVQKLFS